MGEQIIYIKAFAGSEHVDDHKYCKAADIGQRNSGADHFVAKQDCCTDQDGNYRSLSDGSLDITKNKIFNRNGGACHKAMVTKSGQRSGACHTVNCTFKAV